MDISTVFGPGSRAMYYSHDTFGLGHLRRTLTLVNHFGEAAPGMSQLVVSGSPSTNMFQLPDNTDIIKLPSVTKDQRGKYVSRSIALGIDEITSTRRDILKSAAHNFRPDFLVVDHSPAGMNGEIVATLELLRDVSPETRLVIGLRDILDEPASVRQQWARDGVYELLDNVYDLILVYGHQDMYDVVSRYGLSPKAAAKTRFVGYLGRQAGKTPREEMRASLDIHSEKMVLVTAGGGQDGNQVFDTILRDLELEGDPSDLDVVIVGGTMVHSRDRMEFRKRAAQFSSVHTMPFTDDLASLIGASDVVVSMGGYNTVSEILALHRKGIIVPRTTPRKEQLIRAQVMSERGYISMIHPDELVPMRLFNEIRHQLMQPDFTLPKIEMNGLDNVVRCVDSLWHSGQSASA